MAAVLATPALEATPTLPRPRLVTVPPAVYRRRRTAAVVLLVLVVVLAGFVAGQVATVLGGGPASVPEHRPNAVHVVQPGDTLWGIAEGLRPAGDIGAVVAWLIRANRGAELTVGQHLVLP